MRRQGESEDKLCAYEWLYDGKDLPEFRRTDLGSESAAHRTSMALPRKRRRRTAEALELSLDQRLKTEKRKNERRIASGDRR